MKRTLAIFHPNSFPRANKGAPRRGTGRAIRHVQAFGQALSRRWLDAPQPLDRDLLISGAALLNQAKDATIRTKQGIPDDRATPTSESLPCHAFSVQSSCRVDA